MLFYFEKSTLIPEFYQNLKNKILLTDDIYLANIVVFKNFEMRHRKFILKNKHLKQKYFCFFFEPITCKFYKKIVHRLNNLNYVNIITYSKNNCNLLKKKLTTRKFFILTNNYFDSKVIAFKKTINGVINNRDLSNFSLNQNLNYNNKIVNEINIKNNDLILFNHWGKERDQLFKSLKIFINLHKSCDSLILETFRITELIKYRVIIISQNIVDDKTEFFKDYIIYENNNIIGKYQHVLKNYNEYYNKIYSNKTNQEIFQEINDYEKEFLNFYNK